MCKFRGQIRNETNLRSGVFFCFFLGGGRQRKGESPFPLASKKKGRRTARPEVKMKQ